MDRILQRLAPWLIVGAILTIVVLRFINAAWVREELIFVVPIALVGVAALFKWIRRKRSGYGATSLSDRMEKIAHDLRARAEAVRYADEHGTNAPPPSDLLEEMIAEVRRISANRNMGLFQDFRLLDATPAQLQSRAEQLEKKAKEIRAGPRPYAMEGRELAGCLGILAVIAAIGGGAMWFHFDRSLRPGPYLYLGTGTLVLAALGFMLVLHMQRDKP